MKKIFVLIVLSLGVSNSFSQTVGLTLKETASLDGGYVLFAPTNSTTTYLIDKCGKQVKSWPSSYQPGQSVYLLPDGTLLRTAKVNNPIFPSGGNGGKIEKIDWNGNLTWSYSVSDSFKCQHHDVRALPNGNVLVIAWEKKTSAAAIAQGRNPSLTATSVWSEQILEIEPVGATGGKLVWEWHVWDHLVQDFDSTKPNFGNIAANPGLININYNALKNNEDWLHLNAIDYNPEMNQILLSNHNFSEIWVIDHSTNSAEAASHKGGNSNQGGDVLYRWGNPFAYNKGVPGSKKFFGQHNAQWIEKGLPNADQIIVFNNGLGRPGGNYSTVEIINPPKVGYQFNQTLPFLPASSSWTYNIGNPNSYYAQSISGAQQLSNGNVLMCNGPDGVFTEITSAGKTVWNYVNPVSASGIIPQGFAPTQNLVFRCSFYPTNYSGFAGKTLTTGSIIENSNTVSASCVLTGGTENLEDENGIYIYPNPARESIGIRQKNGYFNLLFIQLINTYGQVVFEITDINKISLEINSQPSKSLF